MSYNKSVTAPVLNLKPSRILAAYTILGHAIALSVLFYPMSLPVSIRMMIALAVIVSFLYHWKTREPVTKLRVPHKDNSWTLVLKDGSSEEARLKGEYIVTSWLIVLKFLTKSKKKITVVVLADSGGIDELRNLRVYLRQLDISQL